jgi:hypothetical protein
MRVESADEYLRRCVQNYAGYVGRTHAADRLPKDAPARKTPAGRRKSKRKHDDERRKNLPADAPGREDPPQDEQAFVAVDFDKLSRIVNRLTSAAAVAEDDDDFAADEMKLCATMMVDPDLFAVVGETPETFTLPRGKATERADVRDLDQDERALCDAMKVSPSNFERQRAIDATFGESFQVERRER